MTNQDIWQIALQQSAYDCNCAPEDFLSQQNLVTRSKKHALARKYLPLPFACDMVSYGNNIVAQTSEELAGPVAAYLQKGPVFRCLETPYLHVLDDALEEFGLQVCFMAEYFLPDLRCLRALPCDRTLRILHPSDFTGLYVEPWSHALCQARRELDILGVGAYVDGRLIGLPTAKPCIKSEWTSCQSIGGRALPPPSPAGWLWKFYPLEKYRFTVQRGVISLP